MSLNPFKTVEHYDDMKQRLFAMAFIASILLILLLKNTIPEFSRLISSLDVLPIKWNDADIPLGILFLAFAIALFFRIVLLHDRVSHLLGIRANYDRDHILRPLLEGLNLESQKRLTDSQIDHHRSKLMSRLFYRYASSYSPTIDRHLIISALDRLSWYWTLLETSVLIILTALVYMFYGYFLKSFIAFILFLLTLSLMSFVHTLCVQITSREVEAILADVDRQAQMKAAASEIFDQ